MKNIQFRTFLLQMEKAEVVDAAMDSNMAEVVDAAMESETS